MPKKILLADDSITIQKVIGLTFANEDVQLTVVDNGDEALIKAREVTPDLIIADVVMPGKDGYEVCYSIKHDPKLAHVPVLLLTGTFETFDETMATKVGANGFITKPFESQALIDKVNELIGQAQASVKAPSINDLMAEPAGLEPAPVDEMAGFDSLDPVEPLEEIAPMELEEVQPVEDNPLEKFASLEPDPEESSFADVSLDEPAPTTLDSFDDLSPAEPDPEPLPVTPPVQAAPPPPPAPPAPAAAVAPAPVAPAAPPAAAPATADASGWNMNDFGDYMADQTAVSGLPADDEPTEVVDMSEPAPLEPAAESMELSPVDSMELSPVEPTAEEIGHGDAFDLGTPVAAESPADAFDLSTSAQELPGESAFDLGASSLDEAPAPVAHELPADESYDLAAEAPVEHASPAADAFGPGTSEPEPAFGSSDAVAVTEESALPEPAPTMPLESVADMYPLDETPEPAPAAPAPEPVVPASVELSSFDEPMQTESLAATIAYEPPPPPPAAPAPAEAPAAAAAGIDQEALQRELGRIPELVETRVRAALETDLMSQVGDRTAKVIEGQVEEAIRKVAPSLIQQLVDKAIADATERILNETIGRLRK